jgi:hypothetical protein
MDATGCFWCFLVAAADEAIADAHFCAVRCTLVVSLQKVNEGRFGTYPRQKVTLVSALLGNWKCPN